MDLQLTGKTAIVTGSTRGIGFAIARALAAEGAAVVICGSSNDNVSAALARLQEACPGAGSQGFAGDLATAAGCDALVRQVPDPDILVNNLGIYGRRDFEDISDEEWERSFQVNVMSGVRLARAILPGMKARNWGRILFVSSESAIQIPAEMVHYGMSKAAQLAVSRGIAETCAGTAVTCNAILPGPTLTETARANAALRAPDKPFEEYEAAFFANARPSSLLRHFADPADVASLAAYVCSPRAAAINGAALRVDGGIVRSCF